MQTWIVSMWYVALSVDVCMQAGLPQEVINEIHGAWFDPSNPVVKMSGELRSDLFADLLQMESKADMCLTLGTSLSGMNADRVAQAVATRHAKGVGHGLVVVNLQRTQMDSQCSLRVWGLLDNVIARVTERAIELKHAAGMPHSLIQPTLVGEGAANSCAEAAAAEKTRNLDSTMVVPYGLDGHKLPAGVAPRELNVADDATIVVTCGPYAGCVGVVRGRDRANNVDLTVTVAVNKKGFMARVPMKLGHWWLDAGRRGAVARLPIANPDPAAGSDAEDS
jgi:hypothetical protein